MQSWKSVCLSEACSVKKVVFWNYVYFYLIMCIFLTCHQVSSLFFDSCARLRRQTGTVRDSNFSQKLWVSFHCLTNEVLHLQGCMTLPPIRAESLLMALTKGWPGSNESGWSGETENDDNEGVNKQIIYKSRCRLMTVVITTFRPLLPHLSAQTDFSERSSTALKDTVRE